MAGLEEEEVMAVEAMGLLSAQKDMPKQAWASTAGHHAEVCFQTCPSSIRDRCYCTCAVFFAGLDCHVCSVRSYCGHVAWCTSVHEVGQQGHDTGGKLPASLDSLSVHKVLTPVYDLTFSVCEMYLRKALHAVCAHGDLPPAGD